MSLRRTAMVRRTELRRTAIRPRATRLQSKAATARRRTIVATGPTPAQRQTVIDRAWGCCEICGRRVLTDLNQPTGPYSIHHRQPRGMGGTRREAINSPANLLLLCGDATTPGGCHAHVETNRARAYANGWLVRATGTPAEVPVLLEGGDWYLLTTDGCRDQVEGLEL